MIPTPAEIRDLHLSVAPSRAAFDLVHTHCEIVWEVAAQLIAARSLPVDADLVRAGCLLHDVGVYRLGDTAYVKHGILGFELLQERGFSRELARFCSHHTGVGLTREDVVAQKLPLPPADYLAETPEERLVMYADKFHSKSTPPVFVTASAYAAQVSRFGPANVAKFAALVSEYGEPDLTGLAARFGHPVR